MPGGTSIFFSGTSLFKLPGAFRSRVGAIHEASEESTDRSKATSLTPSETSTLPRPCDLRPYAVPDATQAPKPGSSHVFRANLVSEGPLAGSEPTVAVKTCWDNFARAVKENGDRPFLGTRVRNPDGTLGSTYEFKTYHETYITVIRISNGLAHLGVKKGSNVGIYAVNRAEWTVSEYGVYNNSAVVVPLYDTLGKEATAYILDATEMEICVASADRLVFFAWRATFGFDLIQKRSWPTGSTRPPARCSVKSLLQHRNNRSAKHLKTIICMDKKVDSQLQSDCSAAGLKLYSFDELEELGMKHPRSDDEIELPTFDTVASIVWTSGTTGMPKGVVTTHGAIMAFPNAAGLMGTAGSFISFSSEDIYCSYLPLAHVFERGVFAVMIHNSARIAFYSGDVTKLLEDIALVRPTIFVSVPRLLNRIYAKMTTALASKPWFIRKLFDLAYAAKQAQIDAGGPPSHWILDNTIFRGARNLLGGQVRAIISGAAPISGQVMGFLRVVFGCDVLEGYGQSECMCIAATMLGDTAPGEFARSLLFCRASLMLVANTIPVSPSLQEPWDLLIRQWKFNSWLYLNSATRRKISLSLGERFARGARSRSRNITRTPSAPVKPWMKMAGSGRVMSGGSMPMAVWRSSTGRKSEHPRKL